MGSLAESQVYESTSREAFALVSTTEARRLFHLSVHIAAAGAAGWILIFDSASTPSGIPRYPPIPVQPGDHHSIPFDGLVFTSGIYVSYSTAETYSAGAASALFWLRYM